MFKFLIVYKKGVVSYFVYFFFSILLFIVSFISLIVTIGIFLARAFTFLKGKYILTIKKYI